jgi:hypothetical protein
MFFPSNSSMIEYSIYVFIIYSCVFIPSPREFDAYFRKLAKAWGFAQGGVHAWIRLMHNFRTMYRLFWGNEGICDLFIRGE